MLQYYDDISKKLQLSWILLGPSFGVKFVRVLNGL